MLREQVAQRLYTELDALADYAANQQPIPNKMNAAGPLDSAQPVDKEAYRQHILSLANSVLMASPALFDAHVLQLSQRQGPKATIEQIAAVRKAVLLRLSVGEYVLVASVLSAAINALASATEPEQPVTSEPAESSAATSRFSHMAENYLSLLLAGDRPGAQRLVLDEAESGSDVRDLYLHVLQPAQREVGSLWHSNTISVAQEHYCTAATASLMAQLQPYFQRTPRNGRRLLAACVAGDLHTLGLQMVADFLEYEGWEVCYLGASTPLDSICRMVAEQGVELLLTAASMPHHVPLLSELVAALRRDASTRHVRVLVGGRPFGHDASLWESTGADAWASNAEEAVAVVQGLFAEQDGPVQARAAISTT